MVLHALADLFVAHEIPATPLMSADTIAITSGDVGMRQQSAPWNGQLAYSSELLQWVDTVIP